MNVIDQLDIEVAWLREIVLSCDEGRSANIILKLGVELKNRDIDRVFYCVEELTKWYNCNLENIIRGCLLYQQEEHRKACSMFNSIYLDMKEQMPMLRETYSKEMNDQKQNEVTKPIVFLSHSSKDKKYGDALRDYIIGLGVPEGSLIYTSHPLHKIPLGKNIFEYLRENISGNVYVIILWSDSYLESPACLNEMGAAWVAQKDYTSIYVPDFRFGNPKYHQCAVDINKMGAVLNGDDNCKASMVEFKQKISSVFELTVDEAKAQYLLDEFMKRIREER